MKNAMTKQIVAGIVLVLAFTISCSAEGPPGGSKNSTSITIDKRAIGTWKDASDREYVFNPDGTCDLSRDCKYAFFSDKMIISYYRDSYNRRKISDYVFSADGKTFIVYNGFEYSTSDPMWLTKVK